MKSALECIAAVDGMSATWNGVINLNKPWGITSAKALYKVRSITGQRKSGHAGTLDPAATGVLVLCFGRATKLVEQIMDHPKVYRATARLDVTSESFDMERPLVPVVVGRPPSLDALRSACKMFEGRIQQVPPLTSAVKVGGQPAYKRAHRGKSLELEPRTVQVHWLHVHRYDWPEVEIEMCTGRGTYVRSLIRDLGARLKTGGCLTSLVRSRVGPFGEADAWTIDAIGAAPDPRDCLIDLEQARSMLNPEMIVVPAPPPGWVGDESRYA